MKIELKETEIIHIMDALDARIEDLGDTLTFGDDPMIQDQIGEMRDLATDLFEAISRQDDGWGDPDDPDLFMDPVDFAAKHDTETEMFNAGVEAREKMKATSRAAGRRALNFSSRTDDDRSEMQKHDVFDDAWNPDDPRNW
jgi:hypothetical protein